MPMITAMSEADVPQIAAIEAMQHSTPWSARSFAEALCQNWCCRVLKNEVGDLLGYSVSMPVVDEEELLTIGVHPAALGQGLGKQLMQDLISGARSRQIERIFLEVRVTNRVAISLYERLGFVVTGRRKNYYQIPADPVAGLAMRHEDAQLMCLTLAERTG